MPSRASRSSRWYAGSGNRRRLPQQTPGWWCGRLLPAPAFVARRGTRGYTQQYDEDKGVQVDVSDDCRWSLDVTDLTLEGVVSFGDLSATVRDDGTISIPDQLVLWRGEAYSKRSAVDVRQPAAIWIPSLGWTITNP